MIDEAMATELAREFLRVRAAKTGLDLVLEKQPFEVPDGYVFFYQARRYAESGDMNHMLIGGLPIFVDRLSSETSYCSAERRDEMIRLGRGS